MCSFNVQSRLYSETIMCRVHRRNRTDSCICRVSRVVGVSGTLALFHRLKSVGPLTRNSDKTTFQ